MAMRRCDGNAVGTLQGGENKEVSITRFFGEQEGLRFLPTLQRLLLSCRKAPTAVTLAATSDGDASTSLQGLAVLSRAGSKNVTCKPGQLMEGDDALLPQHGDGACRCLLLHSGESLVCTST